MRNKSKVDPGNMFECPTCDSTQTHTETAHHKFKYGSGDAAVELTCQLPVRVCTNCGGRFIDGVGEMVRHEAVCRHLNCLTPAEMNHIRENVGTQAAFAELTGIGEASLSRWETGASMPSKAYDNYLYLLTVPENLDRLRARNEPFRENRFQVIRVTDERLVEQRSFSLRRWPAA